MSEKVHHNVAACAADWELRRQPSLVPLESSMGVPPYLATLVNERALVWLEFA